MAQQSSPASTSGTATSSGGARLSGGLIATLTGSGLLIVFMLQNTQDVTLEFLFWGFTWPLWLFTLVDATLGAILWIGLGVLRRHRRRVAGGPPGRIDRSRSVHAPVGLGGRALRSRRRCRAVPDPFRRLRQREPGC